MPKTPLTRETGVRIGPMGRRDFVALVGGGAAALLTRSLYAAKGGPGQRRPSIIVIVADDLGYADLGVQGCTDIPTPSIDSLAQNGVRFTNGYVSCPVCSPTRAGLLTGRYQQRFGHEFNPGAPATAATGFGLPLSQVTLADALKAAGYATGMVGKWHLGLAPEFHPLQRGFDEFFGFLHGSHSYLNAKAEPLNLILRGTEPVDEPEYLTDAFTREALAFIERHRAAPFFLYLTYNAVHAPMQATQKYLDRFAHIADEKRRTHAAMLSAMDDGIGAVLGKLREAGLEEDTMVFFISDNGGPTPSTTASNLPLSGTKGTMREGGIRVPFILQWPRRLRAGRLYEPPVISLDMFPTAVLAAGGKLPRDRVIDGVDLMPYLSGKKRGAPHEILFWRMGPNAAVRKANWKLIRPGQTPAGLYDLSKDISESNDLAARNPKAAQQLGKALAQWESQLAEPLWGGARAGRARRQGRS